MPEVPVTTSEGGRTKGRSWLQCAHRSMTPTAGIKSLQPPQASHVNGTSRDRSPVARRAYISTIIERLAKRHGALGARTVRDGYRNISRHSRRALPST